jgi:hypothetical protein
VHGEFGQFVVVGSDTCCPRVTVVVAGAVTVGAARIRQRNETVLVYPAPAVGSVTVRVTDLPEPAVTVVAVPEIVPLGLMVRPGGRLLVGSAQT